MKAMLRRHRPDPDWAGDLDSTRDLLPEMHETVAEERCRHSLERILAVGTRDPVKIICSECGRQWTLVPDE